MVDTTRTTERLPHCTGTLSGHSPLCDRDGTFCSAVSTHDGPCTPHGQPRDEDLDRGTGPNRYPTILRDSSGRPVDVG